MRLTTRIGARVEIGRTFLSILGSTLLVAGCCTTAPTPDEPLSFHVAVMPLDIQASSEVVPAGGLTLDLDGERLATALSETLAGRGFVRVSLLEQSEERGGVPESRLHRERYWQERAQQADADMIVRVRLDYDTAVDEHTNDKFCLNLPPFFLLGGPFCYFLDDRSYKASAGLQVDFFDLTDVHDALLDEYRVLELSICAEFEGTSLDFIDRAGSSVRWYLASLVVPAGLLARQTDAVQQRIETEAVEELTQELLSEVLAFRLDFHQNDLASFHLDESSLRVRRAPDGTMSLAIPFVDTGGTGLRAYSLSAAGHELLRGDLSDAREIDGRIWIQGIVVVPTEARFLRLRVEDATDGARSYTFRVDEAVEE